MEARSDEWALWFAMSPKSDRLHLSAVSFSFVMVLHSWPWTYPGPIFCLWCLPPINNHFANNTFGGGSTASKVFLTPSPWCWQSVRKQREKNTHGGRKDGIQPAYRERVDDSKCSCSPVHWRLMESARQRTLQLGHRHTVGFLSGGLSRWCYRYVHLLFFSCSLII